MMVINNILLILSHLFISSVELLYMIFPLYVYACYIIYYSIISFIFSVYLFVSIYYSPVRDL